MKTSPRLSPYFLGYDKTLQVDDEMVEIKEWSACKDTFWPYSARIYLWLETDNFGGVLVWITQAPKKIKKIKNKKVTENPRHHEESEY